MAQSPEESKKYAHEIGKRFIEIQDDIKIGDVVEGAASIKTTRDVNNSKNYFAINWVGLPKTQYYIRLGYFLEFLQNTIIPTIDSNTIVKLLKIDYDVATNLIYTLPRQISSDPKVCVFKASYLTSDGINYDLFPFINGDADFIRSDNFASNYGQIMNIYFNMDYIINGIDSGKDDKGRISLYSLLNLICKGWNESTGNYNSLEPVIDSETNTIKLVDSVALPDRDSILKELNKDVSVELAYFDIFRYGTYQENKTYIPHAGFIKDLSFNTTVGSNLATMITVGSTANGYVVGEDATALSRMNAGLTDRFKDIVGYPEDENNSTSVYGTASKTLEERYKAALTSFNYYVEKLSKYDWTQDAIDDFSSLQTQLLEYEQANQVQTAANDYITQDNTINQSTLPASANGGFLPFDLSLTMDGLSGMKVYQKFSADVNFLPTNYPDSLEFIIKGITHTISDNQWTTNIESFAIPLNPFAVSGSIRDTTVYEGKVNNYSIPSTYSNVSFTNKTKADGINSNLLNDINTAAINAGLKVTITTAVTGHDYYSTNGTVSRHGAGNAVDIAIINGIGSNNATNATNGSAAFREYGNKLKNALVALGYSWNIESGQSKAVLWQTDKGGNHYNHVHISRRI